MKTFNIVKACVAVGFALAYSFMNTQTVSAQTVRPLTTVGQQTKLMDSNDAARSFSVWEERLPDPGPGFRAYNVRLKVNATNTAGLYVNAFEELDIAGVHQVWEKVGRNEFTSVYPGYFQGLSEFIGQEAASRIQGYDSSILFTETQKASGTADPSETNDKLNVAGLDVSFGLDPADFTSVVGMGSVGIKNRTGGASAALGLNIQPADLAYARVVLYDGTAGQFSPPAILNGGVGGQADSDTDGEVGAFANVLIGQTVQIPEPAMSVLALIGGVGLFGLRRRNS